MTLKLPLPTPLRPFIPWSIPVGFCPSLHWSCLVQVLTASVLPTLWAVSHPGGHFLLQILLCLSLGDTCLFWFPFCFAGVFLRFLTCSLCSTQSLKSGFLGAQALSSLNLSSGDSLIPMDLKTEFVLMMPKYTSSLDLSYHLTALFFFFNHSLGFLKLIDILLKYS